MNTRELWKPIDGFPGYDISASGRVRSTLTRMTDWTSGQPLQRPRPLILKPKRKASGHLEVCLRRSSKKYMRYVHRLVLQAFHGKPRAGSVGCHVNGDPADNRLQNLTWASQRVNARQKAQHGTQRHNLVAVKDRAIRHLFAAGMTFPEIGAVLRLHEKTIRRALRQVPSHDNAPPPSTDPAG